MIAVYSFKTKHSLGYALNVAEHRFDEVNEEFNYCVDREKGKEILTLREMGIPYVVFVEQDYMNKGEPGVVIDTNIDLSRLPSDFRLIPRWTSSVTMPDALKAGVFYPSEAENQAVLHWPEAIHDPDIFLKRNVFELSQAQFNEAFTSGSIQTPVFIKGVDKGNTGFSLHQVFADQSSLEHTFMSAGEAFAKHRTLYNLESVNPDTIVAVAQAPDWYCEYREGMMRGRISSFNPVNGVILSDPMTVLYDDTIKQEYRAYIVEGKVSSLSAYVDYKTAPIPAKISEIAQQFAEKNTHLAGAYVADFGMTNLGPVLIELNPFPQSGRYLDNDPVALFKDLTEGEDLSHYHFIEPMAVPQNEEDTELDATIRLESKLKIDRLTLDLEP